ncbi:hypothetical protein [Thalassospira sp.]|uniref:hypothetical protein n=1 Tax=Thalassospira sp. TaxID=1912094 RepID=UPI0032ED77EF
MNMPIFIAVFSRFIAQWRDLAAAGVAAPVEEWSQVIVDGRRRDDQSRVRQDKAPAPSASIANGKPLSAHCFFGRLDSAKRYAVVPDLRQHPDFPQYL